jgi:predicted nucleic acid-binding protein
MLLVDSNSWVYFLDEGLPEHDAVSQVLSSLLEEDELVLTTVIQMEVAHYVVRRAPKTAEGLLEAFFAVPAHLDSLTPEAIHSAVEILKRFSAEGIGGRDATILDAAIRNDVSLLLTSDKKLARAAKRLKIRCRDPAAR